MDAQLWNKLLKENTIITEASKFEVWIEKMQSGYSKSKPLDNNELQSFDDRKSAQKYMKDLMKKYNLQKHAGHVVNYRDQIELFTNF